MIFGLIVEIGEEIDVLTSTTTTSTLAFTLFSPTTTTEATTTTTVTTTTEPKVANAIFWGAKNIVKACIAIVTGFVILSVFAHGFWMIGTDSNFGTSSMITGTVLLVPMDFNRNSSIYSVRPLMKLLYWNPGYNTPRLL